MNLIKNTLVIAVMIFLIDKVLELIEKVLDPYNKINENILVLVFISYFAMFVGLFIILCIPIQNKSNIAKKM